MTEPDIVWLAGEPASQRCVERALATGLDESSRLHESKHRSVYSIKRVSFQSPTPNPASLALKVHHRGVGLRGLRESLKRSVGRSPARREWRALSALREKGVSVAHPRAWGRLSNGDEIIVCDLLEGEHLAIRFRDAPAAERRKLVGAMARTIQALHGSGYRHGDLHLGNLWAHATAEGDVVHLLDLDSARPARSTRERLVDLAQLEFSLARAGWDSAWTAALRNSLNSDNRFGAILRSFLRDHLRGRGRRVLRLGRNWAAADVGTHTGLREASLDAQSLSMLIESSEVNNDAEMRRGHRVRITEERADDRRVVVKRITVDGLRRALADRFRGSPAARAFRAGQRRALLSNHAARPLAYLEQRRFGLPFQSWLVLEKVGQGDLDQLDPGDPGLEMRVAKALGAWLADAHSWGLVHRDLKGGNIRVSIEPESIRFWLVDLEDLQGPIDCSDDRRLRALSQLNASLSDRAFGLEARRAALDIYTTRAPFAKMDLRTVSAEIARRSLIRKHRWRGLGCDLAQPRVRTSSPSRTEP